MQTTGKTNPCVGNFLQSNKLNCLDMNEDQKSRVNYFRFN